MDGIRYIGGPQNISGMTGASAKKIAPQTEKSASQISDSVTTGMFTGSEIKDPRKAFMFAEPEVKDTGNIVEGAKAEKTASLEERYQEGVKGDFSSMGLNGPSNAKAGIVTVSGKVIGGNSNPKFLIME